MVVRMEAGSTRSMYRPVRAQIAVAVALAFAGSAWAGPTGMTGAVGVGAITQAGGVTTITTTATNSVANWTSFNIGANEKVVINQPSAASAMLNRVVSANPTEIYGQLTSNGKVWLVNPAGIMVGNGAVIDTAGLVASTLTIKDSDFLAGRLTAGGDAAAMVAGKITNNGAISGNGGSILIIAPQIENNGVITSPGGEIILAAGHSVQILNSTTPGVLVEVTANKGELNLSQMVASGQVSLSNTGTVSASNVVNEGGRVFLRAAPKDGGVMANKGIVAAEGATGKGGFIDTSGSAVDLNDGAIKAGSGGTWLIDPSNLIVTGSGDATSAGSNPITYTGIGPTSTVQGAIVNSLLGSGTNVVLDTQGGTAGTGDITFQSVVLSSGTGNLVARAGGNVIIDGANGGQVTLSAAKFEINAGGAVTQTAGTGNLGSIVANELGIKAAGGVTLNHASNAFPKLTVDVGSMGASLTTAAANLLLQNTMIDGVATTNAVTAGSFTLNTTGSVSQSAPIQAAILTVGSSGARAGDIDLMTNGAGNGIVDVASLYSTGKIAVRDDGGGLNITGTVDTNGTGKDIFLRTAGGNLILGTGSHINNVNAGAGNTAIALATDFNFVNNAGSSVLSTDGRWLVYSSDPSSISKGGLTSNFRQYGATLSAAMPNTISTTGATAGNGFIYIAAKPTVAIDVGTASGAAGHIYGDSPTWTSSTAYRALSTADNEDVAAGFGISGTATISSLPSVSQNVGSYTAAYTGGLSSGSGFSLTAGNSVAYSVTARPVSLTGTRTYDGTTAISFADLAFVSGAAGSGAGLLAADSANLTLAGTGVLDSKNAGTRSISSQGTLSLGGTAMGNYSFDLPGSSVTVNKANLTLSAVTATKTYDGGLSASGAPIVAGLVGSDTVTGPSQVFASKNVLGTNGSTVQVGGYTLNDGNGGGNYNATYQNAAGTITPKAVTYTFGVTSYSQPQGSPDPGTGPFNITLSGVVAGDSVTPKLVSPTVGGGTLVSTLAPGEYVFGAGLSGADAGNYVIAATGNVGGVGIITASVTSAVQNTASGLTTTTVSSLSSTSRATVQAPSAELPPPATADISPALASGTGTTIGGAGDQFGAGSESGSSTPVAAADTKGEGSKEKDGRKESSSGQGGKQVVAQKKAAQCRG